MSTAVDADVALKDLLRRLVTSAMAEASVRYQPTSQDEAKAVRDLVVGALSDELTRASDAGLDDVATALRRLRDAVVADYAERTPRLSRLRVYAFAGPLPALTMAQRLYRDASRADDLVARADPVHPAIMPRVVTALAS